MAVPTPTINVGGVPYYVGQSYAYQGGEAQSLYDANGNFVGFRSPQGTLFSGPPGVQPPRQITVTPTATAGTAAGTAPGSSYYGTGPSYGTSPTINYPGAPPPLNQPGATASLMSPDQWQQFASASPRQQEQMGVQLGLGSADIAEFSRAAANAVANQQAAIKAQQAQQAAQPLPEQNALGMMGQIDPTSEATRTALAGSYLTPLTQAGTPTAAQFQSLLDVYGQVDPTGAAARTKLGQDLAAQEALGTQLDPQTQREIEQGTRSAQAARGNVYGTPQLVAEAMTRGQAGMAIQQQRQQALQSYLGSGISPGDLAMGLYQQQQGNLRAAQNQALGYLGSGQTPLGAATSYLGGAEAGAAGAAQGGPVYNPASLGQTYTGAGAAQFPQYGTNVSQLANQWYNSLAAYGGGGAPQKNRAGSAASGALTGAVSGAATGTAISPGIGTAIGAIGGGILGGASGYFG